MPQWFDGRSASMAIWSDLAVAYAHPEIGARTVALRGQLLVMASACRCDVLRRRQEWSLAACSGGRTRGCPAGGARERRQHLASNEHDGHRAAPSGGARIACDLRAKVCKMTIAWPQCQHTNVGG